MTTLSITTENIETATLIMEIMMEVERAEKKHPVWPDCHVKQIAFVAEESGELVRAGNLLDEGTGTFDEIRTEAIHTAATALRFLKNLPETKKCYYSTPVIIDFLTDDDHEQIRKEYQP